MSPLKNNIVILSVGVLLATGLMSCQEQKGKADMKPVAKVNSKYLYQKDLNRIIPPGSSSEDSTRLAKSYIDQWIKRQLLYKHAEFNLAKENLDFEYMIDDYRASLMVYEYEKQLLQQKVDTVITMKQINDYYQLNLVKFELSSAIVKALYIRIENTSSKIGEIRTLLRQNDNKALEELVGVSFQYADRFDLFDEKWISLGTIFQKIPNAPIDEEDFLRHETIYESKDETHTHFLQIHEYMLGGETAPVEYVQERIRDLVISLRKLDFIKDLENNVYQDAVRKNEFEVYD